MQRLTLLVALFCWGTTPALGQEWQQYVNTEDGFAVNFPGSPNITETPGGPSWTTGCRHVSIMSTGGRSVMWSR